MRENHINFQSLHWFALRSATVDVDGAASVGNAHVTTDVGKEKHRDPSPDISNDGIWRSVKSMWEKSKKGFVYTKKSSACLTTNINGYNTRKLFVLAFRAEKRFEMETEPKQIPNYTGVCLQSLLSSILRQGSSITASCPLLRIHKKNCSNIYYPAHYDKYWIVT